MTPTVSRHYYKPLFFFFLICFFFSHLFFFFPCHQDHVPRSPSPPSFPRSVPLPPPPHTICSLLIPRSPGTLEFTSMANALF